MSVKSFSERTVVEIYDDRLVEPDCLAYPTSPKAVAEFLEKLAVYHEQHAFVGFVDGAYDVPTENHVWSLRDCRHRLAEQYFGDAYRRADDADKIKMMASDKIVLIVTVDADAKVAYKKGYKAGKGNIARPVYDWQQRANRVGGFMIPDGKGGYRPVVDLVTVDGDPMHRGTFLESHLSLGSYMVEQGILGAWLLYSWHEWFEAAKKTTDKYVVMSQETYAFESRSGMRASSTGVIERIKSTERPRKGAIEQTRPARFLGSRDHTYTLLTFLPREIQVEIDPLLQYLAETFSGLIWPMPEQSLHITLYELMQRGDFGVDKDEIFLKNGVAWERALNDIFGKMPPVEVALTKLVVNPDAITLQCESSEPFNEIRAKITKSLALPRFTKHPPDITHCTLARFLAPASISEVQAAVDAFNSVPRPTFTIQNFQLLKTTVQPVQEYEVLRTFPLLGAHKEAKKRSLIGAGS